MSTPTHSAPKHGRVRRFLASGAVTALLVGGMTFGGAATAAHAGTCTKVLWMTVCGVIKNDPYSATSIKVGTGWNGKSATGNIKTLAKGKSSSALMKDADAVYIPAGYCGRVSPHNILSGGKWHKLHDSTWNVLVSKKKVWGC